MASIMPFPNVATHRRLPHLSNSPKSTPEQLQQQQQQQQQQQLLQLDHTLQNQSQDNASSHLRLVSGSPAYQQLLEDSQGAQPSQSRLTSPSGTIQDNPTEDQTLLYGRAISPLGALSPSASFSTLNSSDSRMIKTALYDAFGCLYHPSAHTKHSAALRSGDVTPLLGLSPKASPLLRPNVGPSAPITPLELSEEGTATGYFALHPPSTPSSPALNGVTSGSASPRHHGHHHRHLHTSSNLSSTYTSEDQAGQEYVHGTAGSVSQLSSIDMDMTLSPEEHPVLSSLRTLSITHPHPLEHYNPHLGHELGHDIIPIDEPISSICTTFDEKLSMDLETPMFRSSQKYAEPPSSSPFAMDQGERDSISGFGQQGLV